MNGRGLRDAALAAGLMLLVAWPAAATRFYDVRDASFANRVTFDNSWTIAFTENPGRVELVVPRPENLDYGGELANFRQFPRTLYTASPPADIEDRSEWYTRLVWLPGSLTAPSQLLVRVSTDADLSADIPGIRLDLSRLPGDYYTSFTPTIQNVPGITEAVGFIANTMDQVHGLPPGELGLAQRWMAYLLGAFEHGVGSQTGIDDAQSAWLAGRADCDGFANMFAAGMRALGFPTCVVYTYHLPADPVIGDLFYGGQLSGFHAWAGVWSEGMGAFVPFDLGLDYAGFTDVQQLELAYLEDLADASWLLLTSWGSVRLPLSSVAASQTNASNVYPVVRIRHHDDGFNDLNIPSHDVLLPRAPGEITGVPDSTARPAEQLLAGTPFRDVLSASLVLREPARVTVELFDVSGRRVSALADGAPAAPGENFYRWRAGGAAEGLYFLRARTDDGRLFTRRVLLRR